MSKTKKTTAPRKRSGTYDKAVADYEKAMKIFHKRQFKEAGKAFTAILEKHAVEIEVCDRARTLAKACAAQVGPDQPKLKTADDHYLAGVMAHNSGDFDAAIGFYEKGLSMEPKDDRLHYVMAASLARAGRDDDAVAALTEASKRNQENLILAERNADFEALAENPQFEALVGQLQK